MVKNNEFTQNVEDMDKLKNLVSKLQELFKNEKSNYCLKNGPYGEEFIIAKSDIKEIEAMIVSLKKPKKIKKIVKSPEESYDIGDKNFKPVFCKNTPLETFLDNMSITLDDGTTDILTLLPELSSGYCVPQSIYLLIKIYLYKNNLINSIFVAFDDVLDQIFNGEDNCAFGYKRLIYEHNNHKYESKNETKELFLQNKTTINTVDSINKFYSTLNKRMDKEPVVFNTNKVTFPSLDRLIHINVFDIDDLYKHHEELDRVCSDPKNKYTEYTKAFHRFIENDDKLKQSLLKEHQIIYDYLKEVKAKHATKKK